MSDLDIQILTGVRLSCSRHATLPGWCQTPSRGNCGVFSWRTSADVKTVSSCLRNLVTTSTVSLNTRASATSHSLERKRDSYRAVSGRTDVFCVFLRHGHSGGTQPVSGAGTHSEHRFPAPSTLKEGCRKPVLGVWDRYSLVPAQ